MLSLTQSVFVPTGIVVAVVELVPDRAATMCRRPGEAGEGDGQPNRRSLRAYTGASFAAKLTAS